jgi:tRNA-splicing ligase RtcB
MTQLGSYGGGNHFGECEVVQLADDPAMRRTAEVFGLRDNHVAFLSHCGSRGFGNILAQRQFKELEGFFRTWGLGFPAGDRQLVYAPLGTPEANAYLDDMALGANFATVNHLLINALVLEAFQEVLPGTKGQLVYFISHNIARQEVVDNQLAWVHRKGATRAFPGGHHALAGHALRRDRPPDPAARKSARWLRRDGREARMPRRAATASTTAPDAAWAARPPPAISNQKEVDADFETHDILYNARQYPIDEAPNAYKDFKEVLHSVESAGLAQQVCKLKAASSSKTRRRRMIDVGKFSGNERN